MNFLDIYNNLSWSCTSKIIFLVYSCDWGMCAGNVIPLTIGIISANKELPCHPVINRNKPYPIGKTIHGKTVRANQTNAKITIYESEQQKIDDNDILGSIVFSGLTASPEGQEIVDITLKIDENGMISAVIVDKKTKKQEHLNIDRPQQFSEDQIVEMANNLAQLKEVGMNAKIVVKMAPTT